MLFEFKDLINPSKLPSRRKYLDYYILGFIDGEGCFSISLKKQDNTKYGWVIDPIFHVTQHKDNRIILEICKRILGCGRIISKPGQEETVLQYIVDNRRHLIEKIIPFFRKNKPIVKSREFKYFCKIVEALENGEHKNAEGLKKLVKMAYELSDERKHPIEEVMKEIDERMDASETKR
jgi:hypothetical protein